MKDINGKEIYIGDKVAFSYCAAYADLIQGRVVKFTPKKICIDYGNEKYAYKYPSEVAVIRTIENNNEDFGTILTCAVRYACGRQTYMPSKVIGFIRPLISKIDDNALCCMERDVRNAKIFGGYGYKKIDKPDWMRFLADLQAEIDKRGIERWV
jgi:hypothetical protein